MNMQERNTSQGRLILTERNSALSESQTELHPTGSVTEISVKVSIETKSQKQSTWRKFFAQELTQSKE